MAIIDKTAIVDPKAEIANDVEIGPFCVIGPNVSIDSGTVIKSNVVIEGHTTIGKNNIFFPMSSIGQITQDLKYDGGDAFLEIGDNNTFREFITINTATAAGDKTIIGNNNHILAYCHIAHDCIIGNHVIMSNLATLAGHVIIEDYVVIGGMGGVHQFCKVGTMSMLGACTKLTKDLLPYTIADGTPAKTVALNSVRLKRLGYSDETRQKIKDAYKIIFRQELKADVAAQQIKDDFGDSAETLKMAEFIEQSKRGILR